ncbi:hypothetical protein B0A55_08930 [Friedmanniomyces simplex]|uniref:Uncharacterized protein n=1 Tax=Friedmanniomyces simplex TaxID=329884 RepID=A0A4U0WZP3_9PEZI|nr:hypothetical protein B0A55_08930 [Friedmanniomyces simplex]
MGIALGVPMLTGSIMTTVTFGLQCGFNHVFMHKHCIEDNDGRRRDTPAQPPVSTLMRINGSVPQMADFKGPADLGALRIFSTPDAGNESAVFQLGEEGERWAGVLRGFPAPGKDGVMGGEFSVQIPGVDEPVAGTWIAVDRSRNATDEKKAAAFEGLVRTVWEGRKKEMTLEEMLELGY